VIGFYWPSDPIFWVPYLAGVLLMFLMLALTFAITLIIFAGMALGLTWPLRHPRQWLWMRRLYQQSQRKEPDEPIGFRYCFLAAEDGQVRFRSMVQTTLFDATDHAVCAKGHKAPDVNCRCGFYALFKPHWLWLEMFFSGPTALARTLLKVQFSGTVEFGEKGYRAHRQDVLQAWLPKRCSRFFCYRHCTAFINEGRGTKESPILLWPVCPRHEKKAANKGIQSLTVPDIRNQLQTDVAIRPL
jgi:hypothetical protein